MEPAHLLWVAELTALGGVIDFSEASVITCTAEYYLDFHHYNSEAGALMMRDIANYLSNRPLLHGRVLGGMPQP